MTFPINLKEAELFLVYLLVAERFLIRSDLLGSALEDSWTAVPAVFA